MPHMSLTNKHNPTIINRILDRPEFNDPEQLQEIFRKGVEEFKEVRRGLRDGWMHV